MKAQYLALAKLSIWGAGQARKQAENLSKLDIGVAVWTRFIVLPRVRTIAIQMVEMFESPSYIKVCFPVHAAYRAINWLIEA